MADPIAAAHLYQSLTQLAYLEARLASQPLVPFQPADAPKLAAQSNDAGNCAARFRQRPPAAMGDLTAAQTRVDTALAMMTAIFRFVPVNLGAEEVYAAVASGIAAVNAV